MVLIVYVKALNKQTYPNNSEIATYKRMIKEIEQKNITNISISRPKAKKILTAVKIFENKMDDPEDERKKLPAFKEDHIWDPSMDLPSNALPPINQKKHNINSFAVYVANSMNGNGIQAMPTQWKSQIDKFLKNISLSNKINVITNNNHNNNNTAPMSMDQPEQTTIAPSCPECAQPFITSTALQEHLIKHHVCICFIYIYIYI